MSFENTHCPCGCKKPTDTMLCDDCMATFADRNEIKDLLNKSVRPDWRRSSAIVLLSLARKRMSLKPR